MCENPFLGFHTHKTACPVAYGLYKNEPCHIFDFAAAARKIGMLMTVDRTNYDLICIDGVEKYTFADADAGDLPVNERSDDDEEDEDLNARDLAHAPTSKFSVRYSKSLTVGVKKTKTILTLCHVAHELKSRTYGEKKWWVVIVKNQ